MELLEIEKELSGSNGQEAMEKYDRVLCDIAVRIKAAMDKGLAPDDFSKCSSLSDAIVVARKLLRLQLRAKDDSSVF